MAGKSFFIAAFLLPATLTTLSLHGGEPSAAEFAAFGCAHENAVSCSDTDPASAFIASAYDYICSARKLSFVTTSDAGPVQRGFFISDGKNGYMKTDNGLELQYAADRVVLYSSAANEIVIQPVGKKRGNAASNPFSLFDPDNKSVKASAPVTVNEGSEGPMTFSVVTPLAKKGAGFKEAKVYVKGWKGEGSKVTVCRIVVTTGSGQSYTTEVVSASGPDPALLGKSVIEISEHPDARITDLR